MQDTIFKVQDDLEELTIEMLASFITKHRALIDNRFSKLENAYNNDYDIFSRPSKQAEWKPDHRLSVNFAQYIVDTFEGFFIGNAVKTNTNDKTTKDFLNIFSAYNNREDIDAELSKTASIFGRAYEIYYTDEEGELCSAVLSPMDGFAIYDESIKPRMRYFVRLLTDMNGKLKGSISDDETIKYFEVDDKAECGYKWTGDEETHSFGYVPCVEFVQNESRRGIFESVLSLINEFNNVLSEKANDVDYYADAYLKVLGAPIDAKEAQFMRENRIINFGGADGKNVICEFLQKPNGDGTQENLLNRLEKLIFTTAMVINCQDEHFGDISGIALKYKLIPMSNLAKTKERKFTAGFRNRYKILFNNPVCKVGEDDYLGLSFVFTLNIPVDIKDEVETASSMAGITSKRTQLSVISKVKDIDGELEQIEKERDPSVANIDYAINRTTGSEE